MAEDEPRFGLAGLACWNSDLGRPCRVVPGGGNGTDGNHACGVERLVGNDEPSAFTTLLVTLHRVEAQEQHGPPQAPSRRRHYAAPASQARRSSASRPSQISCISAWNSGSWPAWAQRRECRSSRNERARSRTARSTRASWVGATWASTSRRTVSTVAGLRLYVRFTLRASFAMDAI